MVGLVISVFPLGHTRLHTLKHCAFSVFPGSVHTVLPS